MEFGDKGIGWTRPLHTKPFVDAIHARLHLCLEWMYVL